MKAKEKITRRQNAREDEEPTEGKTSPVAGAELLIATRKATVLKLLDQQRKVIAQEAVGHPNKAGEMAEVEGLVISVIGVINGDTDRLNVQK